VSPASRWIAAWVACGLALRLAFALGYWVNQPMTHDEREYLALARSLAAGHGFTYPDDEPSPGTAQRFGRAPGYPVFLALIGAADRYEHAPARVKIVQSTVGAIVVWLIAALARRASGDRAGIAAAAVAALYPPLVWISSYVWRETLFSMLALVAALLLARGAVAAAPDARGSNVWIATAGLVVGIAILTRPVMIFFVPLGALWLWRRRDLTAAILFIVIAAACVLPWMIRNHGVYGRWMIASEGGVTFWTGNHPLAVGDGDLAANPRIKEAELAFRAAHAGLTPEQLEPLYYRDALDWIRREPFAWLALLARKAFYTIVPAGPSYALHSTKYVVASVVSYVLVLVAAVAGAWRWRARGRSTSSLAPLWLMAAATVVAGLVFFPQERFRIPVIDPALIVTAALSAGLRNHERTDRHPDL
jgi:4-amino-4-deoxy-L-arabinose transferase-like glycosyltransferase